MIDAQDEILLNNAAWFSLIGPHSALAEGTGMARRYPKDVSPFYGVADFADDQSWRDLRKLTGATGTAVLAGEGLVIPDGWTRLDGGVGVQMTGEDVFGLADKESVSLNEGDVPEMLDLVARAQPGPFLPRTNELGGYLGIRNNGKLVAMAGYRLNPLGWREISAVCTDADFRGQGLGRRVVLAVSAEIRRGNEIPFLHVAQSNENAIRLYENLGFRHRATSVFAVIQAA